MLVAADSATAARSNVDHASSYECRDCGKLFRRDAALRRHRELSHAAVAADDVTAARCYRCQTCRRPFSSRAALNAHVCSAHGLPTAAPTVINNHLSVVVTKLDAAAASDKELLLVEDCCVDDEICIAADGGSAASEFQTVTTPERDSDATTDTPLRQRSVDCTEQTSSESSLVDTTPVTASHCNNNNNSQTKNKNILVRPAVVVTTLSSRTAGRSSSTVKAVDVKLSTVTSGTSAVQANRSQTSRRSQTSTTTAASVCGSTPAGAATSRLVSACRAGAAESPNSTPACARETVSQRSTAHAASDPQISPNSPVDAETLSVDARTPADSPAQSELVPTSTTTQKIIVYVKTEPNHQQIAYCAAESTTSGASAGKASSVSCQFVCPVCGRDFASEKYLSMHVSSIHRAANDVASVIALETASAPTSEGRKTSVAAGAQSISAADSAVSSPVTASGILASTQPTSSTSVGGSKSHWTCNICQKAFAQNSSYKNHIRTHSDDRPYVCSICSIGFKERYHLKKHELFKHTTALNETCRICGKCFKDSTAVRAHERIHSDVRPYGCTLCGKTFKTSECLWHHENRSKTCGKMASRNKVLGVAAGIVTVPRQRQRRSSVNHAVSAASTLSRQSRQASVVASSPCFEPLEEDIKPDDIKPELAELAPPAVECDKVNEDDCKPPLVESSSQEVMEDSEVVIKMEPDCELFDVNLNTMLDSSDTSFADFWPTFDDLDAVAPGYGGAAVDSRFPSSPDAMCSSPDTTDADSTRSAEEISTVIGSTCSSSLGVGGCAGVKRYDCARCDKRFASAATLTKHLQVHAEVRPYRCTVCDIGFKLKVHLKKHNLYRHSEEYPCECSICGKRFKDSSAVRLHERIHSAARPFQCLHCGKSFKTRENLWGHRNRGPCEQRTMSSLLVTSPATTGIEAPQFVASNVRLFHSAEYGPILGVPVNAKLIFKDAERLTKTDERPANVSTQPQLNVAAKITNAASISPLTAGSGGNNLRRVSAVRVGDTTRLAVSKIATGCSSGGGLSLVSVPTAVVTPIKREMINDPKLSNLVATTSQSVLAGNLVLSAPPVTATNHVLDRKRPVIELGLAAAETAPSPHKYLAVADNQHNTDAVDNKLSSIQRLLSSTRSAETLLSPSMEQNLADALSALAGSGTDSMMIEGDCLPPINDTDTVWAATSPTNFDDDDAELDAQTAEDWSELVATPCDQMLISTDDDDALSDSGATLSDYQRLVASPCLGQSAGRTEAASCDDDTDVRCELASDAMWCNWAPENDLGSLLIFGP